MNNTTRANHSNIRKVDPFSFEVSHKRLAWLFRISVMMNFFLSFSLVSTAAALFFAYPLKETRFVFLRADSAANTVYRVEPLNNEIDGFSLFLETKAKEFVSNIMPISKVTQNERYEAAFSMASDDFFKNFSEKRFLNGWLKEAHDKGLNRSVIIENAFTRPSNLTESYLVTVDYIQVDRFENSDNEGRKHLSVNLEMVANPQLVSQSELYENPLGIVVTNMSISARK